MSERRSRLAEFLARLDAFLLEADDILEAPADAGVKAMVEDLTKRLLELREGADEITRETQADEG